MTGFKILLLSVIAVFAIWGYALYNYEPGTPTPVAAESAKQIKLPAFHAFYMGDRYKN